MFILNWFFLRFSDSGLAVLGHSRIVASRVGGKELTADHLVLALLDAGDVYTTRLLEQRAMRDDMQRHLAEHARTEPLPRPEVDMKVGKELTKVLRSARTEARSRSRAAIAPIDLVLGLLRHEEVFAAQVLAGAGITYETAEALLKEFPAAPDIRVNFWSEPEDPLP